ncbi:MAG: electron transfer flavoprotein subunit beta/FixA family protein [Deltaproteobacteria bacterium]|nr:electron transfer flavoprotein subunit beta/FixA family protein [Deltaproteobacteria bacterium]MBF0525030.1 electron transfer flavoprotein subunit beta/FixA family protein [Deltaproteobacteria bacterium]
MEIIACIKQVPDTESQIKIAPDGKSIVQNDIKWVMNPYDEFGVEEALKLKAKNGGTVTVVSVGPKRVTESIRTALAMGADKGILVEDAATDDGDSFTIAKTLAAVVKNIPYDVIFCGQRAVDDDEAQVGAMLAEMLNIPHVSLVVKEEVDLAAKKVTAEKPIEGATLVTESSLPVLLTTQKGLNEPRYASLPGIMKAKKKPLETKKVADLGLNAEDVGLAGSKLKIMALTPPPQRSAGKIVEGETPQEKAAALVKLLREEAKII